jgi:hypothetical protein
MENPLIEFQAEAHISQSLCFPFAIFAGFAESKAGSEGDPSRFKEGRGEPEGDRQGLL